MYSSQPRHNIIRDYDKTQGTTHPSDLAYQILRDYHVRYITIQNSSTRPIGVAITTYISGPTPEVLFSLSGGEIKHLGINSHGGPPQFIWILDLQTGLSVSSPTALKSDSNAFVLRDGINKWWVNFYSFPSYAAAH